MKVKNFLSQVDHDKVHQAIQAAELKTSARLVVYISHRLVSDPLASGQRIFRKLGLESPQQRASLLIFVAPRSRKFAVLGGSALHEKLGQPWWNHLADIITGHFRQENFTAGLLAAIEDAGRTFRSHFGSSSARPTGETDIYER